MTAADEARKAIERAVTRQAAQNEAARSMRNPAKGNETGIETPDRDKDES
jgi:hypothetical protein